MAPMKAFTRTDPSAYEWAIDDVLIQLREWGARTAHVLPTGPVDDCTIGAAEGCTIRLRDPSLRVSRLHAQLLRDDTRWLLRDAGSKNGIRLDGARRSEIVLAPGAEIGIGGITLIAESTLSIVLRGFLERLLGWADDRAEVVDQAFRSVRMAATRRAPLVLCGDDDLVSTARSLHRHARGTQRPFVVCDPRRRRVEATVRSAANYASGSEALAAAPGGTLCVHSGRPPRDLRQIMEALRNPSLRMQLVVCAESQEECEPYHVRPVVIPPLAGRAAELDRIIQEYAEDAIAELGVLRPGFMPDDHTWMRQHACKSLPEIEKGTLRLVALRASRNVSNAAERLGMAPVSLARWIGRREMPMELVQ